MIDVLRPLLRTWQAKWAERPPKVMRRSQRQNNLQICSRRDSNTGGSDLWTMEAPLYIVLKPPKANKGNKIVNVICNI